MHILILLLSQKYKMRSLHNFSPFHGTNICEEKCNSKNLKCFFGMQYMLVIK